MTTAPVLPRDAATVPDLLRALAERQPQAIVSYHRTPAGDWSPTRRAQLWTEVRGRADALRDLGVRKGDRLAILARTCREWQVAELAGLVAGGIIVGIDAHATPRQIARMLEHADASGLIVDTPANLEKMSPALRKSLSFVIMLDEPAPTPGADIVRWADATRAAPASAVPEVDPPVADDPATLIYTSGTTGAPKGVEYSHRHLLLGCRAILEEFPDLRRPGQSVLAWLPMGALFQRMMNLVALAGGITTYFVDDPHQIMARVREVKPSFFVAVPRFYEKLDRGFREHLARQSPWRRRLVRGALAVGAERARRERSGQRLPLGLRLRHAALDRIVLRRIRAVMGGRMRWMISGAAPTPAWLLERLHGVGLLVLEAYGLTENTVPIAANRSHAYRFGSVGKPFAMNEIRFTEDGELLVRGPGLFQGYHREGPPEGAFTADGFYRTGDYARVDADGFLFLVGRKSELIKTSTGHRIAPAQVEAVYRQSPYVDEIVVVGNNRKHLAALVTVNAAAVLSALSGARIDAVSHRELSALPRVRDLIRAELEARGPELPPHERIHSFTILPEPLSIAGGELTSTLKLRRDRIEARYQEVIHELYDEAR